MTTLDVYLNGYLVGYFIKDSNGAHLFSYAKNWLIKQGSRPISLSMPLSKLGYKGNVVYNYFDNLLPDNMEIRQRILARHPANSTQPFDLLAVIGKDCVGALQLLPQGLKPTGLKKIEYKKLTTNELNKILKGYLSNIPLGMIEDEPDFRISIAGAQEKTALLNIDNQWCLPKFSTPTSHIIKLPIGKIKGHSYNLDLSDSVENEFLCMLILHKFGLPVAKCKIIQTNEIQALAVERFDRKYSKDKKWIIRIPQEDYCQVLNVPSALKYENQGGPGIKDIMEHLLGSKFSQQDRYNFMKAQVLFWLLGASDGHAKNFSIFILSNGQYHLTPFYDVMSIYPVIGEKGLNIRKVKLAMGLKSSKGKKYNIDQIYPRHFLATAKFVGFDDAIMSKILNDIKNSTASVIEEVKKSLPADFPTHITNSIFNGILQMVKKIS